MLRFIPWEEASVWLGTIPDEAKNHYPTLKELFLKAFNSEGSFFSTYHLISRLMRPGETLKSYLTDVYKLFSSSTFSEEHKIMLFIKGLRDDLHAFVIAAKPKTFLEAIESAKLKESLLAGKTPGIKNTSSITEMTTLNALSRLQDAENSEFSAKLNEIMTKLTNIEARDTRKDKNDLQIKDNKGEYMSGNLNEIIKRVTAMEEKEKQTPWRQSKQQKSWDTNNSETYSDRKGFDNENYPNYNETYNRSCNNERENFCDQTGN